MSINAFAPAGVLGSGRVDARPYVCDVVRRSLLGTGVGVQGTGLPVAGDALRFRTAGAQALALNLLDTDLDRKHTAQNDGTTLGLPPSRRPPS